MSRFLAALLLLGALAARAVFAADSHSYSNPDSIVVRHLALELEADFDAKRLKGRADLTVERVADGAWELVLDSRGLEIAGVELVSNGKVAGKLGFEQGPADRVLGSAIRIRMPEAAKVSTPEVVRVRYSTGPDAGALQWLGPAQTAGKRKPFLYTHSQPIQARTWLPVQDTPGVRMTYSARIRTPPGLLALMSAENPRAVSPDGSYRFEMRQPVPAYLVALAVGDLAFRPLGPRTGVYAEPSMLEAAAREFADLEAMVGAGEQLYGPYRWERYDLLIMPPSFPVGGMENPRLSFITPTVIAGDRSLVSMITHELAHSWSGNLVTNATWDDFWLNEGVTTYLERRLLEATRGRELAEMEAALGYQYLEAEMTSLQEAGRRNDTALALYLKGRDPDEARTDIPYEKGYAFLTYLEQQFGRAELDRQLRAWFERFAFTSVDTLTFTDTVVDGLVATNPDLVSAVDLREWVYGVGMPGFARVPTAAAFAQVEKARDAWIVGSMATTQIPAARWVPQQWMRFLDTLPADRPDQRLVELDQAFRLSDSTNWEIARSWLLAAVRNDYRAVYPRLERFLVGTGRQKMVQRLYEQLARTPEGTAQARAIYAKARPGYHPETQRMVDRILGLQST